MLLQKIFLNNMKTMKTSSIFSYLMQTLSETNEFGAFFVQDALEAPMAAPAPREFPRELPESLRKPPRCLREQKKTLFGFSR